MVQLRVSSVRSGFVADIARRFIQIMIVLFGVSFVTFLLTYLAPGDPAQAMYEASGIIPTTAMLERSRALMGLDQPFVVQYLLWLKKAVVGDLGISFSQKDFVFNLLVMRLGPTIKLSFLALGFMLVVSLPLGILSAIKQNRWLDRLIQCFNFVSVSMPGFWFGLMLMYVFAIRLGWISVLGKGTGLDRMILPAITLAFGMVGKYTRQIRTAFLEEWHKEYVIGARARGLSEWRIIFCHILPNALLPLLTILGLSLGSLLGGTAVVEVIYAYPGLGSLAVTAVKNRDYPLIQGVVLWIALVYMLINFMVDVSYRLVDPSLRKSGKHL